MTRALIIGAHGFSAMHLARRLAQSEQVHLTGADLPPVPPADPNMHSYVQADLGSRDSVARLIVEAKPDWIFNLAALTSGGFAAVHRVNLLGPIYLLDAVRAHCPDARIILIGSAAEYGLVGPADLPVTEETPCRPVGDYGVSKYAMTLASLDIASRHSIRVVVARPFNIVGAGVPKSLVVGAILARAREALEQPGEPVVKVGNLDTERDFVDAEDAADAYIAMIKGEFWGDVFNVCSGRPVRIRDVVTRALSHSPRPIRLDVDPALARPSDCPIIYGSCNKARRAFGFVPKVSLDESLARAWNHAMRRP